MSAALLLLAIGFLHYVPVFGARKGLWGITVPLSYLQYTSVFDLLFEILLGFGTVMVLMEGVRREVEMANKKLLQARDQLELLVQMDPLTEALNRHAFHSLLRRPESGQEIDDIRQRGRARHRQSKTDQRHDGPYRRRQSNSRSCTCDAFAGPCGRHVVSLGW